MANNKVYSNYLMHGRTKGSRNGISTTKGYRAVGHKARGRLSPDGRYIYDMSTHKKYVTDGLSSAGMGSNRRYELNTKSAKKNGIDVNFAQKTVNSLNKGADNPWQQKANAAQYKDLYRDASRSDTSRNTWQQNAKASEFRTRNVDVYDPTTDSYQSMDRNKVKEYNKTLIRKLEGTLPNTLGGAANQSSTKGTVTKPNTQAPQNNWQQQGADAQRKAEAKARWKAGNKAQAAKKSAEQGAKNNWQQQASLEQWKKQSQNSIAEKKAIQKKKDLIAKADASYAKNLASEKGAKNNWQQKAAREAAGTESKNKVTNGSARATYMPRRHGGDAYVNPNNLEIDTTRKPNKTKGANAMRNDPRYSTGLGTVNFMTSSQRDKYDYSGKRDDRAPTFYALGKKPEKMDRTPYWDHMANATNKQELAKAQAKSKEFMNDFRESKIRNSRSDIGNALADAKEDAKKAWKKLFSKKKKKK